MTMRSTDNGTSPRPGHVYQLPEDGPLPDLAQYDRLIDDGIAAADSRGSDAIAITTYSAIFNLNSYLDDAQTLVFDDAHAAEGYVAEAWALSVGRE